MKNLKRRMFALAMTFALAVGSLGLSMKAQAAPEPQIRLSSVVTDGYEDQRFSVTVDQKATYIATSAEGTTIDRGDLEPGTYELAYESSSTITLTVYIQYDKDGDGDPEAWQIQPITNARAYRITLIGQGEDGRELWKDQVQVDPFNNPELYYQAPATWSEGNVDYTTGTAAFMINFGDPGTRVITYSSNEKPARSYNVQYLDQNDNVLFTDGGALNYGESTTVSAPATYEANGKTYQLESTVSSYDVNYENVQGTYTFEYAEVVPAAETPYEITINLVDADNGNALLYSLRQTVDVNSRVTVELPATYEVNLKKYVQVEGEPAVIERAFGDTRSREYTVRYTVAEESAPYEIYINYVEYGNPENVLSTVSAMVEADAPYIYDVNSVETLNVNGTEYRLVAGQGNDNGQIVHTYDSAVRTYSVYYTSQTVEEPQSYTVTLRYISVNDNTVLETREEEVEYGADVSFGVAPESLQMGDTEYIRLNGQSEEITHGYNESQTSYAVYYRDASIPVEEEPEVVIQTVTQYVTRDDGTTTPNADGTTAPTVVPVTTVTGDEETTYAPDGTPVTIDDQGQLIPDEEVPLAPAVPETDEAEAEEETTEAADEETQGETAQIEDETVPMAASVPGGHGPSAGMIAGISAAAVAVIAAIIAFVVVKKKRNAA